MPIREQLIRMTRVRFFALLLATVFVTEAGSHLALERILPTNLAGPVAASVDAFLLVVILAPFLWWMIIQPLQSGAVSEQQRATRLAAVLEATPDLVSIADLDGRLVYMNRAGRKMLGMDERVDLTKHNLREFHDAANVHVVLSGGISTAVRDGAWSGETELRALDGHAIAVSQVILAHKNPDGTVAFVSTIARDITERKQADETLRHSHDLLDQTGQVAKVGGWELDLGTQTVRWTKQVYRIHEVDPAFQPSLAEAVQFYAPEARPLITAAVQAGVDAGTPFDLELPLITAQGRHILVRAQGTAERRDGKTIRLYGAFQDITERRRAEEALRESEETYRSILNASPDDITITDLEGRIIMTSPAANKIFGYERGEEESGLQILDFLVPEDVERARANIRLMYQGSYRGPHEYRGVRKDRSTCDIEVNSGFIRGTHGQPIKMVFIVRDITKRRQADEARRLQSAALQATADAIVISDRAGVIEWVNPAFTQLTGYTAEEALGKNPRDLVKSGKHAPAFFQEFWETLLAGRTWSGEMINRRKDGSLYTEEQTVTPILDASGAITHFVAIKKDITERVQLEAQFRQAQKMESVGQLASGIAHDFNNLLTVINGMAELLLAQVSHDDPVHTDVEEILHAGERAATLTRQLLAFSRQQILEPRVLNLNTVVAGMESLFRRLLGEDIDLVVVPTPGVGHVKTDPGQIEQVITNLAVNARDAMPQGGRLTIETQCVTVDEDYARQLGVTSVTMPSGSYVMLAVSDSGAGMDEATRTRIFEPFFTTKGLGKGTGLGLSTVYGIVKQSHGFIWVYSEVGQGTSFKIYLPQVTEAAGPDQPGPTVVSSSGTETILLAEDNAGLRRLATRVLELAGYTVLGAATGEEALHLLKRHEKPVHLLLSDVVMPGLSGRDLAEQLAQTHSGMKVLYMSGYTSDTIVRHGVLEAQVPFLNKPFTAAALLRKVREVLDS